MGHYRDQDGDESSTPGPSNPGDPPPTPADKADPASVPLTPGRSALEIVLSRIERTIGHDRIGTLVESHIRKRFLLLDSELVTQTLIALLGTAFSDLEIRGPESLVPAIDDALRVVMIEAESEEIGARLHDNRYSDDHIFAMQSLGVEVALITRASRRFNGLPDTVREIFFAACLSGESLDSCIARGLGTKERIGDAIYLAFTALLTVEKLDRVRRKRNPKR